MQVEFISLSNALEGIAACISVHECTICPEEKKFSSAAGLLHQLLNNAPEERPRWVEINSITARPVFSDAALYPEGMEILLHTAGWHERERENHVKHLLHLAAAKERGIDPSLITKGHNLNDGRYPRLQLLRPRGIGFDRTELISFLDQNKIEHKLTPVTSASKKPKEKKWNKEKLLELRAFRDMHGTTAAATHYGVSASYIRKIQPKEKDKPKTQDFYSQLMK